MPKGSSRKPKSMSKNMVKQVEKVVEKALTEELEEKRAISQYEGKDIKNVIPSGDQTTNTNSYLDLMAPITQVANSRAFPGAPGGAYGFRIGDEINLKKVIIKGYCYLTDISSADALNTQVGVRVMILKQKDKDSFAGFRADSHANKLLLDTVGGSGYQGPGQFNGGPLDLIREINRNEYSVRYDKVIHLSRDSYQGSSTSTRFPLSSNKQLKFFEHELTFGKGKKINFTDGASNTPNNFPYLLVIGQANMANPGAVVPDGMTKISVTSTAVYTDA